MLYLDHYWISLKGNFRWILVNDNRKDGYPERLLMDTKRIFISDIWDLSKPKLIGLIQGILLSSKLDFFAKQNNFFYILVK